MVRTAASTSGGSSTEWPTRPRQTLAHIDELGTPASNNHYNTGWAWAFDTPFPYWKRWAGAEGGVSDMCIVSWPAKIAAQDQPRPQYIHAVDVVPTIYDLLGIVPPEVIKGYQQIPIEGESFAAALTDAHAPGKTTQFYAMLGQRSIYHEGWLACTVHPPLSGWGRFELDEWELFNLEADRSQTHNLAAQEPERLEDLKALWFYNAGLYHGLPLDDRSAIEQVLAERPHAAPASRPVRLLPERCRRPGVGRADAPGTLVHDRCGCEGRVRRRRRRDLGRRGCAGWPCPVREGWPPAVHVQLDRHDTPGRHRRSRGDDRCARLRR